MNSQSGDDLLSFENVECFLNSYQSDLSEPGLSLRKINTFLNRFKDLIINIGQFNEIGDTKSPVRSLSLRGVTYGDIDESSCDQASLLSKHLGLNYDESLRVIAQTKSKTDDKVPLISLADAIYRERNAVITTTILLLNNPEIPKIEPDFLSILASSRSTICENLISTLKSVLSSVDIEVTKVIDELTEKEWKQLWELKRSRDLIFVTLILRELSYLVLNTNLPSHIVEQWFTFLHETRHQMVFIRDVTRSSVPELISRTIESLIVVNSLLVLGLDSTSASINLELPYYSDANCFKHIYEVLKEEPINPVILYMWAFVLFTKSFMMEENPEVELPFAEKVFGSTSVSRLTSLFASRAESAGVIKCIEEVADALSSEGFYPAILSSFLTFSLNFIPINLQTSGLIKQVLLRTPREFVEKFLTGDEFEKQLTILRAKFPLLDEALLPLVNITAVHAQFANFEWKELNTYTTKSKLGELDYDIVDDGINAPNTDLIILKKEVLIKPYFNTDEKTLISIPVDTRGRILPTARSRDDDVIVFLYNYSGWSLLGFVLQNICDVYFSTSEGLDYSTEYLLVAILDLISNVLSKKNPYDRSLDIMQHLSTHIRDGGIVSVIFKIFEHSLQKRNYRLLCVCSDFVLSLFSNFPQFVWSHWARSALLDRNGKTGLAEVVLGSIELPIGKYDFTISLVKLANEMVTEAVSLKTDFPLKTKRDMLDKLITHLLDVYESYQFWKYEDVIQRFEMGFHLNSLFTKILYSVYGVDLSSPPDQKITRVLAAPGSRVVRAFLSSHSPDVRAAKSLLNILNSSLNSQISLLGDKAFGFVYFRLVKHSYELAFLLISIRGSLQMPPSSLEKMIFGASSNLVDIYNSVPSLKRYIVRLFKSLVEVPWADDYLFLLSYLGQRHSKIFLTSISSDLEGPLADHKLAKDIYMFFSALMESKQDGLSILFLTGDIASNKKEQQNLQPSGKKSILRVLKKNALHLDALPESVGCCLLDAIAYAFNTWANSKDFKEDSEFIIALLNLLKNFEPTVASTREDMLALSGRYKLISRTVEIFALYLFTSADMDPHIFQLLDQTDLSKIINPYFEIDGYNESLHKNLHEGFKNRWPDVDLKCFVLSPLFQSSGFSNEMVFAIPLMDQFFGDDEKWVGTDESLGYRDELLEASINLQYVNQQIAAAKAWGALLTTFIKKTTQRLKPTFIDLVLHFLQVNIDSGIKSPLFTQVYCERLELSFYILYAFQKRAEPVPENKLLRLLDQIIIIFKSDEVSYLDNISYSRNRNFYRPILRCALILLDLVTTGSHFIELAADSLLEFFELSFCKGFHLILSEILSDISVSKSNGKQIVVYNMASKMQDLFMLLSLFTKIRALKPPESFKLILASSMNECGTVKVILSLYSTSHLLKINNEAILGPLTLTFVSELCSVKNVAEKFIINGLFSVLLESPVSVLIQKGDVRPESEATLHSLWTNGLLSIILLLLSEFGVKVLPECCLFLSYFVDQVKTAILRWSDGKLAISTALIKETSQLILLQKMLDALDYQSYLSNSKTRYLVDEDKKFFELLPGLDTVQERRVLSTAFERLLTHPKYLNSRIVPTSLEELRLLEDEHNRAEFVKHISRGIKKLQESLFKDM